MNNTLYTNPLGTVQYIPIFIYLNLLSDFLFVEKYLMEINQNKQIPVVNALYEYLEDHHDNETMILKLIRYLLKGSDLYGEEENETSDLIFVNTMFDYIIKSLVFDKYGNIYGFLADVVRKAKTLELSLIYSEIKVNLEKAIFQNEYGGPSTLSSLSVNRILTDIILPLFPRPKTDLNLLSPDYIYAQAGLHFLQPGRVNKIYYSDLKNFQSNILDQENLFDEYLTMGLMLENLHNHENITLASFKAFALPALFVHVTKESEQNDGIKNTVFDPHFWTAAYENLFFYLHETFGRINDKLNADTIYQIHVAFSTFYNRSAIAKLLIENHCQYLNKEEVQSKIADYFYNPEGFQCNSDHILPNLNEAFMYQVNKIIEAYKIHDLKSVKQSFGISLLRSLKYDKVIIQLLVPDDKVKLGVFNNHARIPFDLFVFYYPENNNADFYALIRENYTTTLIKEADNPEDFQNKTGMSVQLLLSLRYHRLNLKTVDQSMDVFWNKFLSYKEQRLESYLKFSDSRFVLGEWWKEFGLPLVPFYPCVTKSQEKKFGEYNLCEIDDLEFFHQFNEDVSSLLIQQSTQTLLTSLGTSLKTMMIRNSNHKIINKIVKMNIKSVLPFYEETSISEVFNKMSLHIEEPGFQLISITTNYLDFLGTVISLLQTKVNHTFTSLKNMLRDIHFLIFNPLQLLKLKDNNTNCSFYIKRRYNARGNYGYGYKYFYIAPNRFVQFRTSYVENKRIFLLLNDENKPNDDEIYYQILDNSFVYAEEKCLFEITNQLERSGENNLFLRISTHSFNIEKCDIGIYMQWSLPLVDCPRHARRMEKRWNLDEDVELVLKKQMNLTRNEILKTMEKYTFPDEGRLDLKFVKDYTNTTDLKIPEWSEHYIIENHALLSKLRFDLHLENANLSLTDGILKIESIYTFREKYKIENGTNLKSIIEHYNSQNARYVTTFEDYYAIRNFAQSGYTRITGDTREANFMKLALYKLAIRQSDDPDDEFEKTLFRIESKPVEIINRTLSSRQIFTLQKFTINYLKESAALNSAAVAISGYKNVLYEMKFTKPYFRAKIKLFYHFEEEIAILLPGTMFSIVNVSETQFRNLGNFLWVTLMYNHKSDEKFRGYKNIMREITEITSIKHQ
ncbi:uncharacterized protein LOC127280310 [Leptopilina boulardi]|uniref:uncharacterized protein LOC127280310 n=1 Tax=Leptopilina boulardi TaxID=63433 RepID=UPI0021F5F426|nr:uncharacterized protein LOC127280310 [Leptopilina boulardi]XP_051159179.1 uncharacterized protein LOC127280310 [Leptopilina boulardi]